MKRKTSVFLCSLALSLSLSTAALTSHAQSIEDLKKGVVKLTAQVDGKTKVGTGFIVRLETNAVYIVTASHVVEGDPKPTVTFFSNPQQPLVAQVVGIQGGDQHGLAALRVAGPMPDDVVALPLDLTTRAAGGEALTFIGFPRTLPPWTVSTGSLSGMNGPTLAFQALVEEGHSGGPLLLNGQVIGVVSDSKERFGYAVPASIASVALSGWRIEAHGDIMVRIGKDGAPMVLIPAGEFKMGSLIGEGEENEHPQHQVSLDAFYIDKFEVTVGWYAEFMRAKNWSKPAYWDQVDSTKHRNLPVVGVDWHDAVAYCEWAWKRLPTEAEWEKAARGQDGLMYPWGNEQPTERFANFSKEYTTNPYGEGRLESVDSYEAGKSPYGLHQMAGNVGEWTADWYDAHYYTKSPAHNPSGSTSGYYRVLHGGSWINKPDLIKSAYRYWLPPSYRGVGIGFRCAQDVPK